MNRKSGILLPLFSIPSNYGIGTLGEEAYKFIDFLADAGQRCWQMLPVGPTGFGDSPYQSFSSYAGNPYFIDLDFLISDGLLPLDEVQNIDWGKNPEKVNYQIMFKEREVLLRKAFARFEGHDDLHYRKFCLDNSEWLDDFSLFMSLKQHFKGLPWQDWDDENIKMRRPASLELYKQLLAEEISYHKVTQFLFYEQWETLHLYAKEKGIELIGDLPIYISMDSADAWVNAPFLELDEKGLPLFVGGVPPDYFSKTGQLWGNPLYDWAKMKDDAYGFWMSRIKKAADMFECLRLDHFRGFESYYKIPYGELTAVNGKWEKGPGMDLIGRIREGFPKLKVIAEDLGELTEDVHRFVDRSGYPGMKVLQFAFGSDSSSPHLPHNYKPNTCVYVGTHDNNTIRGWLEEEATSSERHFAKSYLRLRSDEGWNWGIISGALNSVAHLCIIQMQDYLDLPGCARTNIPGTIGGNWQWRLKRMDLCDGLAFKIRERTKVYGR